MRQITLLVSIVLYCFLTCGALQVEAAAPKPPQKHHQAAKKKSKPGKKNGANANNKAKAAAKGVSQNNSKKQAAKTIVEKDTVVVGGTGGTIHLSPASHHEPQAVSDAQLLQAQQLLLAPPPTLEKLQQARTLLVKANWNYDGHRARAQQEVEYAIGELPTDQDEALVHIKKAIRQLDIALQVN